MSQGKVWVVVAWREDVMAPVPGTGAADLGRAPDLRREPRPQAAVWLSCAPEDVDEAAADARRRAAGRVFVYPGDERDPLRRARADVMGE